MRSKFVVIARCTKAGQWRNRPQWGAQAQAF